MRRRWRVAEWVPFAVAGGWFVAGLFTVVAFAIIDKSGPDRHTVFWHHGHLNTIAWVLPIWAVVPALYGLRWALPMLLKNPPLCRGWEPVEDIREAYRDRGELR